MTKYQKISKPILNHDPKRVDRLMEWIIYGSFEDWARKNKEKLLIKLHKNGGKTN